MGGGNKYTGKGRGILVHILHFVFFEAGSRIAQTGFELTMKKGMMVNH